MICLSKFNKELFNIIIMGLGFLFVFGAFQTSAMAEQSILESADNGTFKGSGYISLATIYTTFALFNWIAPIIVVWLGPRVSIVASASLYVLFVASFLKPMVVTLYLGSCLVGLAAAVLWTAQGNYLSQNSTTNTIGRNTGIFWALFQASLFFGNLFQYFELKGSTTIADNVRFQMYMVLTACGVFGLLLLMLLRSAAHPTRNHNEVAINEEEEIFSETADVAPILTSEAPLTPLEAFIRSFRLVISKRMLLLMVPFAYTGIEMTFFSGVFGTCLGHTVQFGTAAKSYIGLSGIFIGLGETSGALLVSLFGKGRVSRAASFVSGYVVHVVACFLTFISLPSKVPIHETEGATYITPNVVVVMVIAYMLGFADSTFQTQIMSLLGDIYAGNDSPSAFALFKFMQSLMAAAAFFYCKYLELEWQLLIMIIIGTIGTICFNFVDLDIRRNENCPDVEIASD